jgi:hypothetical protein
MSETINHDEDGSSCIKIAHLKSHGDNGGDTSKAQPDNLKVRSSSGASRRAGGGVFGRSSCGGRRGRSSDGTFAVPVVAVGLTAVGLGRARCERASADGIGVGGLSVVVVVVIILALVLIVVMIMSGRGGGGSTGSGDGASGGSSSTGTLAVPETGTCSAHVQHHDSWAA